MAFSHDLIAAFAVGFMGSLHCIGMCGGISSALTTAIVPGQSRTFKQQFGYQLLFSVGRISAYSTAGAAIGLAGATLYDQIPSHGPSYLRMLAGIMMILLGLYISGWWKILNQLERIGVRVWKHIAPITRTFIPVDRPHKAVALGFLWGWLPCGLVYSALPWSLGSGGAERGALLMLYFGLGTLPAMLSVGTFSQILTDFARNAGTRMFAALMLMGFGVWTIVSQMSH